MKQKKLENIFYIATYFGASIFEETLKTGIRYK